MPRLRPAVRTPADTAADNARYYDQEYQQGFATDLPDDATLQRLISTNFAGTEKDYSYYMSVLAMVGAAPGGILVDLGRAWGFGSYQLARAGYRVTSYDIARHVRGYGRDKLGLTMAQGPHELRAWSGACDVFFSAHVLEHVPAPREVFDLAFTPLRDRGLFVAFTPNGSDACPRAQPAWHKLWGEAHPNFIDDEFLRRSFAHSRHMLASSPLPSGAFTGFAQARDSDMAGSLAGPELIFVAEKNASRGQW